MLLANPKRRHSIARLTDFSKNRIQFTCIYSTEPPWRQSPTEMTAHQPGADKDRTTENSVIHSPKGNSNAGVLQFDDGLCASWFHTFCGCDETLSDQMQLRGGKVFSGFLFPGRNPLSKEVMAETQTGFSSRSHGGMLPAGLLRLVLSWLLIQLGTTWLGVLLPTVGWELWCQLTIKIVMSQTCPRADLI